VDQLGFGLVVDESYESGGRWVAVAPPDGNTVLALITPKRKAEEYKLIGRCRHAVLVTEDVMAKFEEWGKRGVRFHHPPQTTLYCFKIRNDPCLVPVTMTKRDEQVNRG
jgi:hypothetical protein